MVEATSLVNRRRILLLRLEVLLLLLTIYRQQILTYLEVLLLPLAAKLRLHLGMLLLPALPLLLDSALMDLILVLEIIVDKVPLLHLDLEAQIM